MVKPEWYICRPYVCGCVGVDVMCVVYALDYLVRGMRGICNLRDLFGKSEDAFVKKINKDT